MALFRVSFLLLQFVLKMLSISRVILALALCSAGVSAVQDLSLNVAAPETVKGIDSLVVTTTLTNTGDETVKVRLYLS